MGHRTFTFEDFSDNFELAVDEIDVWPTIAFEMKYRWHPPEPDVGLFDNQLEITDTIYYLEDVEYENFDVFCAAVYERIADDIEGDEDDVVRVIREQLGKWQDEIAEDADS